MDIATAVNVAQHSTKQALSISAVKKAVEHERQIIQMISDVTNTPSPPASSGRGQNVDTYA